MTGTKLDDPVGVDHKPDLKACQQEIEEYLKNQRAYDLFNYLLKDLLTKRPADPLEHMISCLQGDHLTGPLQVVLLGPPGLGISAPAKRLAMYFGLEYISAKELQTGAGAAASGFEGDLVVSKVVMDKILEASSMMRGFVLEGFPQTRAQMTFLKEAAIVPTHVLDLQASEAFVHERQQQLLTGELEAEDAPVPKEALRRDLTLFGAHRSSILQTYKGVVKAVDVTGDKEAIFKQMVTALRTQSPSSAPWSQPRILILGPRGIGAKEHASRLATRLGAIFVDGRVPEVLPKGKSWQEEVLSRLLEPDCIAYGWVMCGFPATAEDAELLVQDGALHPSKVIVLEASVDTCTRRLRHYMVDPLLKKVWTTVPSEEFIRQRLVRHPKGHPAVVTADYEAYTTALPGILETLDAGNRCARVPADGAPQAIFKEIVDTVERPLPIDWPKL